MSRNDSRNEIFISALDLFSLLLFAFLRLALASRASGAGSVNLQLPAIDGHHRSGPTTNTEKAVYFSWYKDSGADGKDCSVRASVGRYDGVWTTG